MLTYDSDVIRDHSEISKEFEEKFEKEVRENWAKFTAKDLPSSINIHLILLPLKSKSDLQDKLHKGLGSWN